MLFGLLIKVACWSFVFVVVLGNQAVLSQDALVYECSGSTGVISITNPDPSTYIWAQVNASDRVCNSTIVADKILVYGCFNQSLTMVLSNEDGLPVIITSVIKFYRFRCSAVQITPEEGVTKKVVEDTHVAKYVSTTVPPTLAPVIVIETTLVDPETDLQATTGTIGQHFRWYIWGPEEFSIEPRHCTTYTDANSFHEKEFSIVPGHCTTYTDPLPDLTVYSVDTHLDGCTFDESLITDFRHPNSSKHLLEADLYAFRFPNSDQVYLQCVVWGCPEGSTACDINCPSNTRRKKRSGNDDSAEDVVPKTPGHFVQYVVASTLRPSTTPLSKEKRSRAGLSRGTLDISMTIDGEPNIFIDDLFVAACPCIHGDVMLLLSTVTMVVLTNILSG